MNYIEEEYDNNDSIIYNETPSFENSIFKNY